MHESLTAHIENSWAGGSRNFVPCGKNTNGGYERSPECRYFPYARTVTCNFTADDSTRDRVKIDRFLI